MGAPILLSGAALALCLSATTAQPVVAQSLDSSAGFATWRVRNFNGSVDVAAAVPGQVHLDLLAAEVLGEPYAERNVDYQGWVAADSWTYTGQFTCLPELLAKQRIELIADGIDTVAAVSLNGVPLWQQTDAFVRTVVEVQALLVGGGASNNLTVTIASPLASAAAAQAACTGFCPPPSGAMQCDCDTCGCDNVSAMWPNFNFIRKPPVHFGWDFAPNFAPSGIWQSMALRGFDAAALDDTTVITAPLQLPVPGDADSPWRAEFTAYVTAAADGVAATVSVTLEGAGAGGTGQATAVLAKGRNAVNVTLSLAGVRAWWPVGLGAATLYNATVTLTANTSIGGTEVSAQSFPAGFRAVALHRPPAPDGSGSLYFFSVNGAPFYAKGANWVPADAFPGRAATPAAFASKLASFAAAGYTVLRVWGGGHPQPESFYRQAAQTGLLLWHEMPFACAGYPTDALTLANTARETADTVLRLQKWSVLVWGGNNEVAWLAGYKPDTPGAGNFSALFFGAMRDGGVIPLDASRPFVSSSPGSGAETPANPVADPAQQPALGDMHVYEYAGDCWDPELYPRPRAVSEFGWQSYSNLPSIAEVVGPASWDYSSPAIQRRDTHRGQPPAVILYHNVGGNWLIPGVNGSSHAPPDDRNRRLVGAALAAATAARATNATSVAYTRRGDGSYALPSDALGIAPMMAAYGGVGLVAGTVFRDTLLLTQLSQARCVATEAEKYRRIQAECPPGGGGGCTQVSLYWMAADLWPAATKGGLEWSGRWKALHHAAAHFHGAPLLVSAWTRPASALPPGQAPFGIYVSAQPPAVRPIPAGSVRMACWSWAAGYVGAITIPFAVAAWPDATGGDAAGANTAGGAVRVYNDTLAGALAACGCTGPAAATECVLSLELYTAAEPAPAALADRSFLYPSPLKAVTTMRDPGLAIADVAAVPGQPGAFDVTLTAARLPAAAVWIESLLCCGFFSDNALLMVDAAVTLRYTPLADGRGWAHAPAPGSETNVTAGQFAASLSVWSLWDTAPYGPPAWSGQAES